MEGSERSGNSGRSETSSFGKACQPQLQATSLTESIVQGLMDFPRGSDGEVHQTFQRAATSDLTPDQGQRPQASNPQVLPPPSILVTQPSAYYAHIVRHLRMVPQISILPTLLRRPFATERPSPSSRRIRQHPSTQPATYESNTGHPTTTTPRRLNWPTCPSAQSITYISLTHTLPSSPRRHGPRLSWRSTWLLR